MKGSMSVKSIFVIVSAFILSFGCMKSEAPEPVVQVQPTQSKELPTLKQNTLYATNVTKPRPTPNFGFQELDPDSIEESAVGETEGEVAGD